MNLKFWQWRHNAKVRKAKEFNRLNEQFIEAITRVLTNDELENLYRVLDSAHSKFYRRVDSIEGAGSAANEMRNLIDNIQIMTY